MNRLIVIVFLFLLLLGTFKDTAIYISFKLNQAYITKNLCVERNLSESTCKGCCQLKIKLNESHQQENDATHKSERNRVSLDFLFFNAYQQLRLLKNNKTAKSINVYRIPTYTFQFINDSFHPPKVTPCNI